MNHNVVRAAELHRRKIFVKRQGLPGILGGPDENEEPTRSTSTGPASTPPAGGPGAGPDRESSSTSTTPTSTRTTQTTPPVTTTTTTDPLDIFFPPTTTSRSTSTSSTERTTRTTSSSSSTTSSSSSTSLTSSSSSIRTTSSTSSTTSTQTTPIANLGTTPARGTSTVFRTLDTSSFGSATGSGSAASATSSNTPTGATSTAAIVGGVIGAIVGIAAVCIFVAFLIRRLRKRRDEEDHFSAAQFRRSAALLDDEFATDGRAGQIQRGNSIGSNRGGLGAGGGYGTSLRPPTMIERHMASTPAAPPVSYGYGQQYDQYGQYPDYGDQQQYSFQPGQVVTPMNDSMAYGVAVGQSGSPPPPGQYYDDHNTYLNRQPSGGHAAYDNYTAHGAYVDMNRMPSPPAHVTSPPPATISPPPATASPPLAAAPATTGHYEAQSSALASAQAAAQAGNSQPVQRAPSANAGQKRPDTVVSTIYNPDDAYGGM